MEPEPHIRAANTADLAAIERLVRDAYSTYIPRLGKPPAPMLADYSATIAAGRATVLLDGGAIAGLIVLVDERDHLLVKNIAVSPRRQGKGLGRALMRFAEREARARGFGEVRLYTNVLMTENIAFYQRLGYAETHRATEDGYARVYLRKQLAKEP